MRLVKPPVWDTAALLAFHKAVFGDARMNGDDQPPAPPVPTPPGAPAPPTGVVSQEEVARIAAREKDQGARAERRRILQSLGLDPDTAKVEDVKKALDAAKDAENARLTEVERREKAAEEREAAAVAREQAAAQTAHTARLTAALLTGGASPATLDDARTLLAALPHDADDAAVTDAVGKLKERLPALFGAQQQTPPPLPSGGGTGTPPRPQPSGDAYERGMERARERAKALAPTATP